MIYSQEQFISRIAKNTAENRRLLDYTMRQRRNQSVDLHGIEFTRQGDNGYPATFYLSISPDMVYLNRLEFKLIIQPFVSSAGVGTNTTVIELDETELEIESGQIKPNPHTHTMTKHSHGLTGGIATTPTTASDFRMSVEGIDVTPYLMAQYGAWISGEGVYPSLDINKNYDLLEVASDMCAEGRKDLADKLTESGYKQVQLSSASPFSATLVWYPKYSHSNR